MEKNLHDDFYKIGYRTCKRKQIRFTDENNAIIEKLKLRKIFFINVSEQS